MNYMLEITAGNMSYDKASGEVTSRYQMEVNAYMFWY